MHAAMIEVNIKMNKKILVGMAIVIIALAVSAIYLSIKLESNFLHPEHCEVSAVAWWDYNPNEPEKSLHMNLTFVELDANATYCFGDVWLNPHNNTLEGTCGVTHGCA